MVRYSYHKDMQHYYRLSRVHKIFITLLTSFYHNDLLWNQVKSVRFIHFTEEIVSLLEIVAENFCSQSSRIQARALESGIWCRLAPKPGSRCLYRWVLKTLSAKETHVIHWGNKWRWKHFGGQKQSQNLPKFQEEISKQQNQQIDCFHTVTAVPAQGYF